MRRALTVMSPGPLNICSLRVRVIVPIGMPNRSNRGTVIPVLGAGITSTPATSTPLTRRFSIVVVPLQVGPLAPHVHMVVDCTVVAVTLITEGVPPSNVKSRLLTVAVDWLEFGVPPAAPPEVIVWKTPVSRLLVVPATPNWTEPFIKPLISEPPVAGRGPALATVAFAVTTPRTFALAITPVAFPLKLEGVCCCCASCVVASTDKNNIAVTLSNIAKNFLFFICLLCNSI